MTSVRDVASVRDVTSTQLPTANCRLPTASRPSGPHHNFLNSPLEFPAVVTSNRGNNQTDRRTDTQTQLYGQTRSMVRIPLFFLFYYFLAYGSIVPPPGGTSEHSAPPIFWGGDNYPHEEASTIRSLHNGKPVIDQAKGVQMKGRRLIDLASVHSGP